MSGWATPDSLSAGTLYRLVPLPTDTLLWEALSGALRLLCEEGNWEKVGTVDVADVARFFEEWWADYQDSTFIPSGGGMEIGQIGLFASAALPTGCLYCDGSSYTRVAYPLLYAAIDAAFIVDADNFVVPDMSDRVPIGSAGALGDVGDVGGAQTHTLTSDQIPGHTHTYDKLTSLGGGSGFSGGGGGPVYANTASGSTGGGSSHNNLQPYIILRYGIKAE